MNLLRVQQAFRVETNILQKLLVFIAGIWLLTRVWAPVSFSSKIEIIILLLVLADVIRTNKRALLSFPFILVPLSFFVPLFTYLSLSSENVNNLSDYVDFEIIPRLTFYIFIAWSLRYVYSPIKFVALFFGVSLLLNICIHTNLLFELQRVFDGMRIDLGFRNSQWTALYIGLFLLSIINLKPVKLLPFYKAMTWGMLVFSCILLIVVSETRAVWLSLGVLGAFFLFRFFLSCRSSKSKLMMLFGILCVSAIIIIPNFDRFVDRASSQTSAVSAFINNTEIPANSIGLRLAMWSESASWIAERPLFGWGAGARNRILGDSNNIDVGGLKHFHNLYIEFLVAYGALGFLFLLVLVLCPFLLVRNGCSNERQFALISIFFIGLCSLFESYLFFNEGVLILTVILAPLLAKNFECDLMSKDQLKKS